MTKGVQGDTNHMVCWASSNATTPQPVKRQTTSERIDKYKALVNPGIGLNGGIFLFLDLIDLFLFKLLWKCQIVAPWSPNVLQSCLHFSASGCTNRFIWWIISIFCIGIDSKRESKKDFFAESKMHFVGDVEEETSPGLWCGHQTVSCDPVIGILLFALWELR